MEISLERCTLRPFSADDALSVAANADDREVWRNLRDRFPHPYTVADGQRWVAHAATLPGGLVFAVDVGGAAIGSIGLEPQPDVHHRSMEIGYWLGRAYWGRGIATEAVVALTEHAFATFDVVRVFAGVFAWNAASVRVLEKAGFAFEGRLRKNVTKDGATLDQLIYAAVR